LSLLDFETSDERSASLASKVKRLFRNRGGVTVPVVVVEGRSDSLVFQRLGVPADQIFVANSRSNVELLLVGHIQEGQPAGGECVFLTDCDGKGKPVSKLLRNEDRLVITQCCDIEADLFALGIVERAVSSMMSLKDAGAYVEAAKEMSFAFSLLRRRASKCSVAMKKAIPGTKKEARIDLFDLPREVRLEWRDTAPDWPTVLQHVKEVRPWSDAQVNLVKEQELDEPVSFDRYVLGKDVIDALFFMLTEDAVLEKTCRRSRSRFDKLLFEHVMPSDLNEWKVGQRLAVWQHARGVQLVHFDT
jgi:hypothetical protein